MGVASSEPAWEPWGREAVELWALSLALPGMRLFFLSLLASLLSPLGGLVQENREASLRSLVGVMVVGLCVAGSSCGGGGASMWFGRWALGIG